MIIEALYLKDFRLYKDSVLRFEPGMTSIFGANAHGKTTALEALYFLITGRSFRTKNLRELVRYEASYFLLEVMFQKQGQSHRLKVLSNGKEKRVFFNNQQLTSVAEWIGIMQGVLITPDHVSIIKGMPSERRQFLDSQISLADSLYLQHLMRYKKAMSQRNQLLKAHSLSTIDTWEAQMAASAAYIVKMRAVALVDLETIGHHYFEQMSEEEETLSITYRSQAPLDEDETSINHFYKQEYEKLRPKEMEMGYTLLGPHREDFILAINGKEAKQFASEGQKQSAIAALKLAEWKRLADLGNLKPLMMIDDFGVSLDKNRQQRFIQLLGEFQQILFTSTEKLSIPGELFVTRP